MPHFTTKEYRLDKGERFTQPDSSRFAVFTVLCRSVLYSSGRKNGPEGRIHSYCFPRQASGCLTTAAEADTVLSLNNGLSKPI